MSCGMRVSPLCQVLGFVSRLSDIASSPAARRFNDTDDPESGFWFFADEPAQLVKGDPPDRTLGGCRGLAPRLPIAGPEARPVRITRWHHDSLTQARTDWTNNQAPRLS